ncbi:MAG: AbrB/MazE/SpoVT family DNA-binding domain-containing protein [Pseudomonadota bacterium]
MKERHVSLFRNGRNQAIRIPREFELEGTEAILRKENNRLIIESVPSGNKLLALLEIWEPMDEDFPEVDDPLPHLEAIF